MNGADKPKRNVVTVLAVNFVLAVALVSVCLFYMQQYSAQTQQQNISDIENINRSAGHIYDVILRNQRMQIASIADYCGRSGMTGEEVLDFAQELEIDGQVNYQLISPDFVGLCTDGRGREKCEVDYTSTAYSAMQKIFSAEVDENAAGTVRLSPEFTDHHSALKSVAFYRYFTLSDEGVDKQYTFMAVLPIDYMKSDVNINSQYGDLCTMVMNFSGDYIISDNEFKGTNLFRYLYTYCDVDELACYKLKSEMQNFKRGFFFQNDHLGHECVYVYSYMEDAEWFAVTRVPASSFVTHNIDYSIAIIITVFLCAILAFNITWMMKMMKRLRVSAENEKNANTAKTEFLSRMSHDMRTPLNSVLNFSAFIEKTDDIAKAKEFSHKISASGRYLLTLINDTLGMGRIETGNLTVRPEPLFLSEFESGLLSILGDKAERKGISFAITCEGEREKALMLDSLRLQQVFVNLLNNAIKFTQPGGSVRLHIETRPATDKALELRFTVSDTGIGMSREFIENNLFKPFSQENRGMDTEESGTGLGLSIAKSLVEHMNGTITCESEIGKGTNFHITLTAQIADVARPEAAPQKHVDISVLEGRRVLVCEDNALNREIASYLLDDVGCVAEEAENGRLGVEMFYESEVGRYDFVLMDVRMPELNGLEATRRIRAMDRADAMTVPIIAMSANAFDEDIKEGLSSGMDAYVSKPVDADELYAAMYETFMRKRADM